MIVKDVPFTLIVEPAPPPPDFFPQITPENRTVKQGAAQDVSVFLNPAGGWAGRVQLSVLNLPAGVTASFSVNPMTYAQSCTITIFVPVDVPVGSYAPVLHIEEIV